ncbi:4Fe-4S binding protein [bacterium]|nr:4Fe-4S binding protein [bacterium]
MMFHITEECVTCGTCLSSCPINAIKEGEPFVISDRCNDCGTCAEVCPVEAIVKV